MRVTSSVALSEAGSDSPVVNRIQDIEEESISLGAAEMARSSVDMRRAARTLTRLKLSWPQESPTNILIVKKELCEEVSNEEKEDMERRVDLICKVIEELLPNSRAHVYQSGEVEEGYDCVITLGGDGTVLNAAWLFQKVVPPIISFHLGTLGFLTVFEYPEEGNHGVLIKKLKQVLMPAPDIRPRILLRMRLSCRVFGKPDVWQVLNEVSIERGPSCMMAALEVSVDGRFLTTATADGLLVATPTGSTAYSLSAGGSVVHPDVPCILLTPVSPHSLSFRPLILPESAVIDIRVAGRSRNASACISFDGRCRVQITRGEGIQITASPYPVPTLCRGGNQSEDWFAGLSTCFRWASI